MECVALTLAERICWFGSEQAQRCLFAGMKDSDHDKPLSMLACWSYSRALFSTAWL